ncbi:MAG: Lrp/AsnC ligand binding domain-containing protein [Rhabdochlamydiaceae bacterium]
MAKAYILVNCEPGSEKQVVDELVAINGVTQAHGLHGIYDVVAEVEAPSIQELRKIIIRKIRKIPAICFTKTLFGVSGKRSRF